jgi:hypothetical protein
MTNIRKKDLKKMCNLLVRTIKPQDLEWLREHRPGIFNGSNGKKIICDGSVFDISFTIQDILNAKRKKDAMGYPINGGLTVDYLRLFAETIDLELPEKANKEEIANIVLQKI